MKKTIVVFANSVKHQKHCVAGKEISTKEWVRPVSDVNGGALSETQVQCRNPYGDFPVKVLQKIEIELHSHVPLVNQPENYLVNQDTWTQCFKLNVNDIDPYLDHPNILWDNRNSSSSGLNDKISYNRINNREVLITQSLYLIKPKNLKYVITQNLQGNRRIRACFNFSGTEYDLAVTDPIIWKWLEKKDVLHEEIIKKEEVLCISLGEPFEDGYCYKLVASSIPLV